MCKIIIEYIYNKITEKFCVNLLKHFALIARNIRVFVHVYMVFAYSF